MIAACGALVPAWREWHASGATTVTEEGGPEGCGRFMALTRIGVSILFIFVVLASGLPILILGPCD